jgi:group I intron endonuclease
MTIGIYKLNFKNTDKVYIGQSLSIESRIIHHISILRAGQATPKLQKAWNNYGLIGYDILIECEPDELNKYETETISIFDSVKNGFNTLSDSGNPILHGENNPNANYENEKYKEILRFLVQRSPSLNKRQISNLTGVSIFIVRHIAALESHTWLKKELPIEYAELEKIKNNPYYRGTEYPKIKSPNGEIFSVVHITNFAKEHGLLQPKLSEVLRGNRKHHKGWSLLEA